jgi:hypothetical protein
MTLPATSGLVMSTTARVVLHKRRLAFYVQTRCLTAGFASIVHVHRRFPGPVYDVTAG